MNRLRNTSPEVLVELLELSMSVGNEYYLARNIKSFIASLRQTLNSEIVNFWYYDETKSKQINFDDPVLLFSDSAKQEKLSISPLLSGKLNFDEPFYKIIPSKDLQNNNLVFSVNNFGFIDCFGFDQSKFKTEELDFISSICLRFINFISIANSKKGVELKKHIPEKNKTDNSNIIRSYYLANIGHEIRNTLSSIIGNTELLLNSEMNVQQKNMLNSLKLSSESLVGLLNNILDYSSIEDGDLKLDFSNFNLYNSIVDVLNIFKAKHEKNLDFTIKYDPELPKHVYTDKTRLQQILFNFVYNLYQIKDKGEVVISTKYIKSETGTNSLNIELEIPEIGVNHETISSFFDSVDQTIENTENEVDSQLFNLIIAKKLTEILGGTIGYQKTDSYKFYFQVNIQESTKEIKDHSLTDNLSDRSTLLEGKTILIVDDETFNLDVCKQILLNRSANILTAHDGSMAVKQIDENGDKIDLILMDIRMPVMDGLEATKIIRQKYNWQKPIIALSGEKIKDKLSESIEAGLNDFLPKPFYQNQLDSMMIKYLNLKTEEDISYDLTHLLEMYDGDKELVAGLMKTFIKQSRINMANFIKACETKNIERIRALAHTTKTTLKYIGQKHYSDIFYKLEMAVNKNEMTDDLLKIGKRAGKTVLKITAKIEEDFYPEGIEQ